MIYCSYLHHSHLIACSFLSYLNRSYCNFLFKMWLSWRSINQNCVINLACNVNIFIEWSSLFFFIFEVLCSLCYWFKWTYSQENAARVIKLWRKQMSGYANNQWPWKNACKTLESTFQLHHSFGDSCRLIHSTTLSINAFFDEILRKSCAQACSESTGISQVSKRSCHYNYYVNSVAFLWKVIE